MMPDVSNKKIILATGIRVKVNRGDTCQWHIFTPINLN